MRTLVIGGSGWLGGETARAARDAGHDVTVLHRGRHPAPEGTTALRADRDGDLGLLAGTAWDLVIDDCAFRPDQVVRVLDALGDGVGHYVLVSSIAAMADYATPGQREDTPGRVAEDPARPAYGEAKAQCERAAMEWLGERALVVRPGLIGGPGDATDRITYWAARAARGGVAIAPGRPDDWTQGIDVRDLAPFLVSAGAQRASGIVHGVGEVTPWGAFLDAVAAGTGGRVSWRWVDADTLEAHLLHSWSDLPAWTPSHGPRAGITRVDRTRALSLGLRTRPAAQIALEAWAWRRDSLAERPLAAGPDPDRERAVLAAISPAPT